jgi:SAM-dependent methyltransferase
MRTNYWTSENAARRYAAGRPRCHGLVVERIAAKLDIRGPLSRAVDVACGTGLSTVPLRRIAREVVGVDESESMLAQAEQAEGVRYALGAAESLDLPDASADLMTASSAFHWFDRDAFLAEAWRVLKPDTWLVTYDNRFYGRMKENPDYATWQRREYGGRFPTPPRNPTAFMSEELGTPGFRLIGHEEYDNDIVFTLDELVLYLTTHSNIVAAEESGRESIESIREWLLGQVTELFPKPTNEDARPRGTFLFGGEIFYLRRTEGQPVP